MIQTTRAISLVLVSAASVLGGYHALKPAQPDYYDQEWGDPSTRPSGGYYYGSGYHSGYYYHHYYGSSGYYSGSSFHSSGIHSSSSFGTSHGGFGSTGHSAHS